MKTCKIKLTGNAADVLSLTKKLEECLGIENIHQMSGMIPGENDERIRYLDVYAQPLEVCLLDNNSKLVNGALISIKSRKEAING